MSGLDPFLWTWDEQYHALVARNMMTHPFKPMLVSNPLLEYDFRNWQANHVWVHKQPFFLWQIALFFRMFGTSEFVLRLPTAIMMSLMIPLIWRTGRLTSTAATAWYAAFLYTFTYYFVQIASGSIATDHNDSAFIFFVGLSIWAWAEYTSSKGRRWLLLIGLFAGIAVLNKWVAGLLVYSGWLMAILVASPGKEWLPALKAMAISVGVTLLAVLPWELFILHAYPAESRFELLGYSRHVLETLEHNGGNSHFYFDRLEMQYGGILATFLIVPGLFILFRSMKNRTHRVGLITCLAGTYLFFSFIPTKMDMFCLIVCPVIFLGLGALIDWLAGQLRQRVAARAVFWILFFLLGFLAWDTLNINKIDVLHSDKFEHWKFRNLEAIIDRQAIAKLPSKDYVVFNCSGNNAIMFMFYSGTTAYGNYPDPAQYRELKEKGVKIATFSDENIPVYLKEDPAVIRIFMKPLYY